MFYVISDSVYYSFGIEAIKWYYKQIVTLHIKMRGREREKGCAQALE